MPTQGANTDAVAEGLEALRREVARLGERVAALEQGVGARPAAAVPVAPAPAAEEAVGEEILLVLSAAVAAFLGKKPHLRQVRLVGGNSWAQQGRVTIQASHALGAWHGRDPQ